MHPAIASAQSEPASQSSLETQVEEKANVALEGQEHPLNWSPCRKGELKSYHLAVSD
jgi:hypothetical protein